MMRNRYPVVSGPRRVRDDGPAIRRRVVPHQAHRIVVRTVNANNFSAFGRDRIDPRLRSVPRHVDTRRASSFRGGSRHRAAVVSFACADDHVAGLEHAVAQQAVDGETGAEQLEGIQTKSRRLVLGSERVKAELRGEARQRDCRRGRQLRTLREKCTQLRIVVGGKQAACPRVARQKCRYGV